MWANIALPELDDHLLLGVHEQYLPGHQVALLDHILCRSIIDPTWEIRQCYKILNINMYIYRGIENVLDISLRRNKVQPKCTMKISYLTISDLARHWATEVPGMSRMLSSNQPTFPDSWDSFSKFSMVFLSQSALAEIRSRIRTVSEIILALSRELLRQLYHVVWSTEKNILYNFNNLHGDLHCH